MRECEISYSLNSIEICKLYRVILGETIFKRLNSLFFSTQSQVRIEILNFKRQINKCIIPRYKARRKY